MARPPTGFLSRFSDKPISYLRVFFKSLCLSLENPRFEEKVQVCVYIHNYIIRHICYMCREIYIYIHIQGIYGNMTCASCRFSVGPTYTLKILKASPQRPQCPRWRQDYGFLRVYLCPTRANGVNSSQLPDAQGIPRAQVAGNPSQFYSHIIQYNYI